MQIIYFYADENYAGKIVPYVGDLAQEETNNEMIDYTFKTFGTLDILINNAGISEYKLFTEETDEDWNRMINTNLYSAFGNDFRLGFQL